MPSLARSIMSGWLLLIACSRHIHVASGDGSAPAAASAVVNQLAGLPPLPKPHYASNSGITAEDVANPARMALWGDFARIAHTLPVSLMSWGADESTMAAVVALASQHNASLSGEYSPWYSANIQPGCTTVCSTCGPLPPNVCTPEPSANETQELDILRARLGNLTSIASAHAGAHPVRVSLIFLDGERFVYNASSSDVWRRALVRKHNLIYDLIKSLAPDATVVQYGRGELERAVPDAIALPNFHPSYPLTADGWPTPFYAGYYTGDERGDCYSMHLYNLDQLGQTRQNFNATATNAIAHNVDCVAAFGCKMLRKFDNVSHCIFIYNVKHESSEHNPKSTTPVRGFRADFTTGISVCGAIVGVVAINRVSHIPQSFRVATFACTKV